MEDPSHLEDVITYLVSDLSSPIPEDRLSASPVPNEQYVKAAMVLQHLPPAAAQARKLGIKKIDHLVVQGKGGQSQKQEAKKNNKSDDSNDSLRSPDKKLTMQDVTNQVHNVCNGARGEQVSPRIDSVIATNEPTLEPCMSTSSDPGTSRLDVSQSASILSPSEAVNEPSSNASNSRVLVEHKPCDIKVEHNTDSCGQEPTIDYRKNNAVDNAVTRNSRSNQYILKRIYSDEDIRTNCNKKRHSDVSYAATDMNDEQQDNSPYVDCKRFIGEEFSELSSDYNQFNNINTRSLKIAGSPNSTLYDVTVDYQHVDSSLPLIPSNPDDEFIDIHDLKEDPLLSPTLDPNPGTKITTVILISTTEKVKSQNLYIARKVGDACFTICLKQNDV